jgi:hypothetical protein
VGAIVAALAPVFVAAALRRLVPPGTALAGTAFLLSSYWSIKYAQQAKQYGTDMLAASIAIWLMTLWLEEARPPWLLTATAGFATLTPWLSFPSVFFLPPLLLTVRPWTSALPDRSHGRFVLRPQLHRRRQTRAHALDDPQLAASHVESR